jgi:peptide/nickel transport system permease protein
MKKLAGQLAYFFTGNPPAVLGTIIIGAFIFFSVFAPVFAPYGPTERDPLKFKFTAETLEELKDKRIPDAALQQLAALEGQEFTDDDTFEAAIEQQLGAKDAKKYGRRIQRAARWDSGHLPPGPRHLFGTTRAGYDVFSQLLFGGRVSLVVAIGAGLISTTISVLMGVTAAYFGGKIDEFLVFIMNVVLVIPNLPLILVLAAFLGEAGPHAIAIIIGITSWAWGARVIRSQTLSIRQREFITACDVIGEAKWRIILVEMVPNLISLIAGQFVGTTLYAVLTEAGLEFIGLGNPSIVTWGTMLLWAQNNSALIVGAWWDMLTPAITISIFGGGLALLNMGMDQISNPQLKAGGSMKLWRKMNAEIHQKRVAAAANQ